MNVLELQQRATCYLCGGDLEAARTYAVDNSEPLTAGTEFEIAVCLACGLGHTNPYPVDVGQLYEKSDASSRDFDHIRGNWIDRGKDWNAGRTLRRRALREFDDPPATVVDFGAGNGRFATVIQTLLPTAAVYAVDYQEDAPKGLNAKYLTVDEFAASDISADLIWCRHVLEHSPDPLALLQQLASRLSPVGRIYIEVPNLHSTLRRVAGKRWVGYYVPRHLFHYSQPALEQLLLRSELIGIIRGCELPLMGNQVQAWLGRDEYGPALQLVGAALHPVQCAIEALGRSSGCLMVAARPA